MATVPLYAKEDVVVAHAIVDESDLVALNEHRWCLDSYGYAKRSVYLGMRDGRPRHSSIRMHRQILRPDAQVKVDHVNRNRLDNRRENLRLASDRQNAHNSRRKKGTSGVVGVTKTPGGRFAARILWSETFDTCDEAAAAYLLWHKSLPSIMASL